MKQLVLLLVSLFTLAACQKPALTITKEPGKNVGENGAEWAKENGAYLKGALESIIASIAYDLNQVLKHPNYIPGS